MSRCLAWLALAAVIPATPAAFAQGGVDIIKLKGNKELQGKVTEVTSEEVSYLASGGTLSEKLSNVVEILFFDAPSGVANGDRALRERHLDEAIQHYQKALEMVKNSQTRVIHKQYALFGIAQSHQAAGNWADALNAYRSLLKECPTTRFLLEAYDGAIICAERKNDTAAIEEMIGRMANEKSPRVRSTAELAKAIRLLKAGKFGDARDLFKPLKAKGSGVEARAQVGLIRCLAAEKKMDDLKRECDTVVQEYNEPYALAAACTALGDVTFAQATDRKDAKLLKEALYHYLRTVLRYEPGPNDSTEDYEKALFHAGICFSRLRDGIQSKEGKQEYANRAVALFEELVSRFAGSPWAAKAQAQLGALKK